MIFIIGKTIEGNTFRPSDWAERLAGNLCSFVQGRMRYSHLLYPCRKDGVAAIAVHRELEQQNPIFFQSIFAFAKRNKLMVIEGSDDSNP